MKKKKAFTLAEVLITIGIIGVVAAMTMPVIVGKYKKVQTINQLKKAYSEINQAVLLAQKDNGTLDSWDLSDFESSEDRLLYISENFLFPYIKVIKKCIPVSSECWAENTFTLDNKVFVPDSSGISGHGAFVTASGYSVLYWPHASGTGAWFWIDVNGPMKKPNMLGNDIFPFVVSWGNAPKVQISPDDCLRRLGFYPKGLDCKVLPERNDLIEGGETVDMPNYKCKKGSNAAYAGGYCAALLIYDGWQMKEDYPW